MCMQALQGADIYCPGTQTKSRSRDILQALPVAMERVRLSTYPCPRIARLPIASVMPLHGTVSLVATGKNVAITAEGIPVSTSRELYVRQTRFYEPSRDYRRGRCPAFIAAGAISGLHIETRRKTQIHSTGNNHRRRTDAFLSNGHVVGDHENSRNARKKYTVSCKSPAIESNHYYENVGTSDELHTTLITTSHVKTSLFLVNDYSSLQG